MRRAGRAAALALLAAVLWIDAGCSRSASPGSSPPAGDGVVRGGRFNFPLRAEPPSLDFLSGSDLFPYLIGRLVCDSLVDHDQDLRIVPRLASSWDRSPDGRVITFHLRPGARFHDGAPLTSRDVLDTYRRVMAPESRAISWIDTFLPIETVETPDEATVRVTYREPYAQALQGWRVPILPAHLRARAGVASPAQDRAPVCGGPFRFHSWEPGSRITLTANPGYWGGPPALEAFVFHIIPTPETTLQALLAGEIDFAPLTPQQWAAQGGSAALARRFQIFRWVPLFFYYIAWRGDGSNPFFTDPAVRRALALALDRHGYVRTVLGGIGRVIASPLPTLEGGLAQEEARGDPPAAGALLDAAGWRMDSRAGVRTRNGVPFRFTLLVFKGGEDYLMFSQVAQENLRALGIEMRVERLDWNTLLTRLQSGDFQAAMSGRTPSSPDPDTAYTMLHSSQVRGGQNYAAFRDHQVDSWLEEGRRTLDAEARRRIYDAIDRRVREQQPYTCLFAPLVQALASRRFGNVRPSPRGILDHYPGAAAIALEDAAAP
jgi:peptide/nickel transport system substrate-binding protein